MMTMVNLMLQVQMVEVLHQMVLMVLINNQRRMGTVTVTTMQSFLKKRIDLYCVSD